MDTDEQRLNLPLIRRGAFHLPPAARRPRGVTPPGHEDCGQISQADSEPNKVDLWLIIIQYMSYKSQGYNS